MLSKVDIAFLCGLTAYLFANNFISCQGPQMPNVGSQGVPGSNQNQSSQEEHHECEVTPEGFPVTGPSVVGNSSNPAAGSCFNGTECKGSMQIQARCPPGQVCCVVLASNTGSGN